MSVRAPILLWHVGCISHTEVCGSCRGTHSHGCWAELSHSPYGSAGTLLDRREPSLRSPGATVQGGRHRRSPGDGDLQPHRVLAVGYRGHPGRELRDAAAGRRVWAQAVRVEALLPLAG